MTQLQAARQGIITEAMRIVAAEENVDVETVRAAVASGEAVIPLNIHHKNAHPVGVGRMFTTKINANLGRSVTHSGKGDELEKLKIALDCKADFVMDLSVGSDDLKAIRQGTVSLKDSYCIFRDGEIFVKGMHVSPYEMGNIFNKDPLRERKLLMHKKEIMTLFGKTKQQGYSLIPLSLYFKNARVKVELGLCKGKKLYDKREAAAQRDAKREIERAMKARR